MSVVSKVNDDPLRSWINPYRSRVRSYPHQIFCFDDFKSSCDALHERMVGREIVLLEIGSGSGIHLIRQGERYPEAMMLGIEVRYKRAVRTIEKAEVGAVKNVAVLNCDAKLMSKVFRANSIDGIFVNFPDPWAKRKQQKHRIFSKKFLGEIHLLLKRGGFMSFKTDHSEYFSVVEQLITRDGRYCIEALSRDLNAHDAVSDSDCSEQTTSSQENIKTEFEEMFVKQKLPVYYLCARTR